MGANNRRNRREQQAKKYKLQKPSKISGSIVHRFRLLIGLSFIRLTVEQSPSKSTRKTSTSSGRSSENKVSTSKVTQLFALDKISLTEIEADGNCLFRAMSFFEERGNQGSHFRYRKEVAQYLSAHKEEYQCIFETEQELNEYIKNIQRERAWGGELELSILSRLYQCGFIIHASGRPDIIVDSCEGVPDKKTYHLAYHLNVREV